MTQQKAETTSYGVNYKPNLDWLSKGIANEVAQTFRFDGCCSRHRYGHCQALCGGLARRTVQASIRAEALSYSDGAVGQWQGINPSATKIPIHNN